MANNPRILSTGELSQALIDKATGAGLTVEVLPFIKTQELNNTEINKKIAGINHGAVIFTSKHAVKAVAGIMTAKPGWDIYCVGNNTATLAKEYFGATISAVADNAKELAAAILQQKDIKEVTFFCGDIRRDELPELLKQNGVSVNEIVVYTTTVTPHIVPEAYDAVLFFSPSAVESFFMANTIHETTILFAIGNTTASALYPKTRNAIMVCEHPDKELLINDVVRYYSTINKTIS